MTSCLIVDDSNLVRKVARYMIEGLGFNCREAEDGDDALTACVADMPDAVLLDWNMPRVSGLNFACQLKQETAGIFPKIVFCTTENFVPDIESAIQQGLAHGYIMKPFDEEIIADKFKELKLMN